MQLCETPEIKLRPDGSIDTVHYMKLGRQKRADQARTLAKVGILKHIVFSVQSWFISSMKT